MNPIYRVPLRLPSQLLFFAGFLLTGMALGGVLSVWVGNSVYHLSLPEIQAVLTNPSAEHTPMLMALNTISQVCTFLLPSVFFWRMFGGADVLPFKKAAWVFLVLPVFWMVSASPLIDLLAAFNQAIIPAGSWLEQIALPMEQQAGQLTLLFLSADNTAGILATYLAIALVPAVCEEVAFRGVLQPLLSHGMRNAHAGIWITAIAFSAIHLQLYGFIPRVLLGAGLGYLVWWSGSLWPALIAHFANNALGVFIYHANGGHLEMELPWWGQAAALVVFGGLTGVMWKRKTSELRDS